MRKGNLNCQDNIENINDSVKVNKLKKSHVLFMIIFLLLSIFMIFEVIKLTYYTFGKIDKEEAKLYNFVSNKFLINKNKITQEEYSLKFAGLGDIYITQNILNGSKISNGYDFISGTEDIQEKLKDYDVVVSSLSTPVAGSKYGYTKSDSYNAPLEILQLLKKLNVSDVATASYHSLDKGEAGALDTIKNIKEAKLNQVGLNSSLDDGKPIIVEKNNIKLGILSYTRNSNVLMGKSNEYVLDVLNEDDLKTDIDYLKSQDVDFIIAYLNVKNDNEEIVSSAQKQGTEMLFDAGVNVVLGTGTKAPQEEVEDLIKKDEEQLHVYAIYSLGDFIGEYKTTKNKESLIANIEFTKKIRKDIYGNIVYESKDMLVKDSIRVKVQVNNDYSTNMRIVESTKQSTNQ